MDDHQRRSEKIMLYKDSPAPNGTPGDFRTLSNTSEKGFGWVGEWVNKSETFTYPTWGIIYKRGDKVESDYGRGAVLAITNEWIIHDNSENGTLSEFAILRSDDHLRLISELKIQSLEA